MKTIFIVLGLLVAGTALGQKEVRTKCWPSKEEMEVYKLISERIGKGQNISTGMVWPTGDQAKTSSRASGRRASTQNSSGKKDTADQSQQIQKAQ